MKQLVNARTKKSGSQVSTEMSKRCLFSWESESFNDLPKISRLGLNARFSTSSSVIRAPCIVTLLCARHYARSFLYKLPNTYNNPSWARGIRQQRPRKLTKLKGILLVMDTCKNLMLFVLHFGKYGTLHTIQASGINGYEIALPRNWIYSWIRVDFNWVFEWRWYSWILNFFWIFWFFLENITWRYLFIVEMSMNCQLFWCIRSWRCSHS